MVEDVNGFDILKNRWFLDPWFFVTNSFSLFYGRFWGLC